MTDATPILARAAALLEDHPAAAACWAWLRRFPALIALISSSPLRGPDSPPGLPQVGLPAPSPSTQRRVWASVIDPATAPVDALIARFSLPPAQIRAAAAQVLRAARPRLALSLWLAVQGVDDHRE